MLFSKSKYRIRHEILKLLLKESEKSTKTNYTSELSLTDEQLAKALKIDLEIIKGETEILFDLKHVHGDEIQNQIEYCISREGAAAYYDKFHLTQGAISKSETFKRIFNYPIMILSLISILAALSSKIESCNNNNKIETIQQTIKELESKLKEQQQPKNQSQDYLKEESLEK